MSDENTLIANHLNSRILEKRDVASLFMLKLLQNPEALVDFGVKNWKSTDSIVMTNTTRQMLLEAAAEQTKMAAMNNDELESYISEPAVTLRRAGGSLLKGFAGAALTGSLVLGAMGGLNKYSSDHPEKFPEIRVNASDADLAFKMEVIGAIGFGALALLLWTFGASSLAGIDDDKRAEINAIRTQLPDAEVIKVLDEQLDRLEPLLQAELRKPIMQAELRKLNPPEEASKAAAR